MKSDQFNGCSPKLNIEQWVSYILFPIFFLVYYFMMFTLSPMPLKIAGVIIETISAISLLISAYIATITDPSDPLLKISRQYKAEGKEYIPEVREGYCESDLAFVHETSKHCKLCGRCVDHFDHHCTWINNCVGKQNYNSFFMMILSLFVFLLMFIINGIILTVEFCEGSIKYNDIYLNQNQDTVILVLMIIIWVFMAIATLLLILDTNLLLFHLYIIHKKVTTYEYVTHIQNRSDNPAITEKAEKALGQEKKRFCTDFILCLKDRRKKMISSEKKHKVSSRTDLMQNVNSKVLDTDANNGYKDPKNSAKKNNNNSIEINNSIVFDEFKDVTVPYTLTDVNIKFENKTPTSIEIKSEK